MEIREAKQRPETLVRQLVQVWEGAVRATHDFLTEAEIARIKTYVPRALAGVETLVVAEGPDGPAAFMGVEQGSLEMLFVAPEARGRGLGGRLLRCGVERYGVQRLAVNEQNPQARGFYEHMGFAVYERSPVDEQGGPYPILYMRRGGQP